MDGDTDNAFEKLIALGERNVSDFAKLATFIETMNGRIEDSFMSAGSDFAAMAEDITEIKYDVTEFRKETSVKISMLHDELNKIRTELTDIKLKVEIRAGYPLLP